MKGILNDQVRLDREKKGFNASIGSIFNFKDEKQKEFFLSDGPIFEIVNREKIQELIETDSLPNSHGKFLFSFITAKLFLEMQQ